jgi:hypothetical protein
MSAPMSVFLHVDLDLLDLVAAIEKVFSVKMTRVDARAGVRFEHRDLGYQMVVMRDHGLEDNMGIPFSRYEYEIDFLVSVVGANPEHAENLKYWLAMYVYGKLAAALGCPAMVVYNLQELIEKTG